MAEVKHADELKDEPLESLEKDLDTSAEGLSSDAAENRLSEYGYNELEEKKTSPIIKFLSYFWGPIPWMIEIAAILSAIVQHWAEFGIIVVLLVFNVIVGFWEEFQAGNAIEALKKKLAPEARVRRDGKWTTIAARELVPGDVIRLRMGAIVPADARLVDDASLDVDQSALTGESMPVDKSSGDAVYSGSIVKQGEANAIVYATGANTYFGKTASLAEEAPDKSHFQKAVLKIGDFLIGVAIVLVVLILAVALFRGDRLTTTLQFVLVLTVAAIPVALPTVMSVTLAVGARFLAKGQAIVSRLASIEELAGMDILCSDKTGTLTQNSLTLGDPYLVEGISRDETVLAAALASREENADAIDTAVLEGLEDADALKNYDVTQFDPFDPVKKRTEATVHSEDGTEFKTSKGAPQVILELAHVSDSVRDDANAAIDDFAERGFRSLGVARTDDQGSWQFLGILPLYDPPREDSKETIAAAREMGCRVKMVTGDQLAIGREIAKQLEMGTNIVDASAFEETRYHESGKVDELIETADGFAQVFPEHKYHIVEVLQKHDHIVGMTGDGVNDAPALQKADCGVAVSGATDAARSAADIVLTAPGLSVIVDAIKESRRIFQRMTSYATYRIAETIRVLLFMTLSIVVFNFYPVTAIMIVLLALLNDGAIISIAYDHVRYAKTPDAWDMRRVLGVASLLGVLGVVASFGLFYLAEQVYGLDRDTIQTLMYLKLSVAGHLTIFVTRTRGPFWTVRPSMILVGAVLGTQAIATLISVYGLFMTPIGWERALLVWGYALAWFVATDQAKWIAHRLFDREHSGFISKSSRPQPA